MRSEIIYCDGIPVFYMDFSFLREPKDIEQVINEAKKYIRSQQKDSLLTLTNVEGMHFNNSIREIFTEFVKGNEPFIKSSAVVGVNGLIQILFNGLLKVTGRNLKTFKAKENALDYLLLGK